MKILNYSIEIIQKVLAKVEQLASAINWSEIYIESTLS